MLISKATSQIRWLFPLLVMVGWQLGQAHALSEDDAAALARGDTVVHVAPDKSEVNAAAAITAAIDINAPPEIVWDVMLDCEKAPKFVPNLKSCEVIETGAAGEYDIRRHVIRYGFIGGNIENIFRSDYKDQEEISFYLVGGDLKVQQGSWKLISLDEGERTRVLYDAQLAIGKPVPRFLIRRSVRNDMPDVLTALREEVLRTYEGLDG